MKSPPGGWLCRVGDHAVKQELPQNAIADYRDYYYFFVLFLWLPRAAERQHNGEEGKEDIWGE